MNQADLASCYQLIAELFVHPDDRDKRRIAELTGRIDKMPAASADALRRFLAHPRADSPDEYIQVLELSPPCPLYLGAYLFDEPTSCRGLGLSGRNGYMLELSGMYEHFGLAMSPRELPDHVPVMVEFLWLSQKASARDRIGLRRRFVESFVQPALEPFRAALDRYQSVYALLARALEAAVEVDLSRMADEVPWQPAPRPEAGRIVLPVVDRRGAVRSSSMEAGSRGDAADAPGCAGGRQEVTFEDAKPNL